MDTNNDLEETLFSLVEVSPVAYVRPIISDEGTSYAVCTSDGTQLAVFDSRDSAYFAAKQHDLEPVLIH